MTVTIELPPGLDLLSPNQRLHWAERNRRFQALKKAAWAMALHGHVPPMQRVALVVEHQPPDRRRRDADNAPTASGKPCIDGLVAAGVLPADDSRHVTQVTYRIGAPFPRGRLVLHLEEVTSPPCEPTGCPAGAEGGGHENQHLGLVPERAGRPRPTPATPIAITREGT